MQFLVVQVLLLGLTIALSSAPIFAGDPHSGDDPIEAAGQECIRGVEFFESLVEYRKAGADKQQATQLLDELDRTGPVREWMQDLLDLVYRLNDEGLAQKEYLSAALLARCVMYTEEEL